MPLMQYLPDSHPYVDSVSMAGDQITLRVEVTNFISTKGGIEISGQATQIGGAFANISQVVDLATATKGDNNEWFVTVTADTLPPYRFKKGQDVTIFVRVSKVWVTVLGEHSKALQGDVTGTVADASTTWDQPRKVSQLDGKTWATQGG
jgi:hypothetical protein